MGGSLAVGGNDNGAALIVMIQIILKGGAEIGIGQIEGFAGGGRIACIISAQMGLPVAGREDPAFVESAGLKKDRAPVGFGIERGVVE